VEGQEDCLYLNVFTPSIERNKLPVMIYIHPGAYMFGRGSLFQGNYLMENKDVVAVVFQYRLGSFGIVTSKMKVISILNAIV